MEKKNYNVFVISILILFSIVSAGYSVYSNKLVSSLNLEVEDLQYTIEFYEDINYLSALESDAYKLQKQANEYFDLAGINYDLGEYEMAIHNCKLSRDYSSDYVQEIREIKVLNDKRTEKLFLISSKIFTEDINIYNNLYEACEYFESASRQYDVEDYFSGDQNIEFHNEKIEAHDNAVNDYNTYLAEYSQELKELTREGGE